MKWFTRAPDDIEMYIFLNYFYNIRIKINEYNNEWFEDYVIKILIFYILWNIVGSSSW